MKRVIFEPERGQRVPVRVWARTIDDKTARQLQLVASQPWVVEHVGTASYIVEGLGSEEAFGSCSHGAGRVMSRKEARANIKPHALARAMRRVAYPEALTKSLVEEAPGAYRDIGEVLDDQEDLVRRVRRLEPICVLKG